MRYSCACRAGRADVRSMWLRTTREPATRPAQSRCKIACGIPDIGCARRRVRRKQQVQFVFEQRSKPGQGAIPADRQALDVAINGDCLSLGADQAGERFTRNAGFVIQHNRPARDRGTGSRRQRRTTGRRVQPTTATSRSARRPHQRARGQHQYERAQQISSRPSPTRNAGRTKAATCSRRRPAWRPSRPATVRSSRPIAGSHVNGVQESRR